MCAPKFKVAMSPHVVAAVVIACSSLGFSIAAFACALAR